MTPTEPEGAADLFEKMEQGEYGALVPAGQARQQLGMTAEALRRLGDAAEGLLGCSLPTSGSGGRQYPAQLLVLMAQARADRAARRAPSQEAALGRLLVRAGWIDAIPDDDAPEVVDLTALRELVADLQAVRWALAGIVPSLLGVAEEQRDVTAEMLEIMRRATLEMPQMATNLERMRANQAELEASTRRVSQEAGELIRQTAALHQPQRALERELIAIRQAVRMAVWGLGGLGAVGILVVIMRSHAG